MTDLLNEFQPEMVTTSDQLEKLCQQWTQCEAVMVDTEFMRTDTFYPIPALIQIGDGNGVYLIDPLAFEDLSAIKGLFTNPNVVKVLHSCSEDLEVFAYSLGVLPTPLFDTQVAAAIAGEGFSVGYANLVRQMLDIELPKGETRSNWLQRPLSVSQIHYAAQDVIYLQVLYQQLKEKLIDQGRLSWLESDCVDIICAANTPTEFDQVYLKVKGAWSLTSQELAILQAIASWREEEARARDIPRNRLLKDKGLLEIAQNKPKHIKLLATLEGVPPRTVRIDGEVLVDIVVNAIQKDKSEWPARLPKPLPPEAGNLMKRFRSRVVAISESMNISTEILARKKDFETIVRAGYFSGEYSMPDYFSSWRNEILEEPLLEEATLFEQQHKLN